MTDLTRRTALSALLAGGAGTAAVGTSLPAFAAPTFVDVPSSNPFAREISWLAERGITTGWTVSGRREFRPHASIQRDAFATFLYRYDGTSGYEPPSTSPFTDLPPRAQFYREITALHEAGIINGWPDGSFRPRNHITRDAVAAMLFRGYGDPRFRAPRTSTFADLTPRRQFYREICWLADTGITQGYPDGTFRPLDPISREAMAAFLFRLHQRGADAAFDAQVASLITRTVNQERRARGLQPLRRDTRIDTVAATWSAQLTTADFRHNPDYGEQMPSGWRRVAENIAYVGSSDRTADAVATDLVRNWMDSDGHRQNILSEAVNTIGVGVATRHEGGLTYVFATQNFGQY
ncbi:MAG: S-layer homology domain-containing protein [Brachybacterium sp.]|nr:S-layer homology domain-containing protein [Brachybacterium sp.]